MKYLKLFAIAAIASVSMFASAAVTSQATITFVSDANGFNDVLHIYEMDVLEGRSMADIKNPINGVLVNIWAENGATNYSDIELTDIDNLVIKVRANAIETAYKLQFSDLAGAAFQLRRESNSEMIDITAGDYAFTCAVNAEETFTVVMPAVAPTYERALKAGQQFGTICYPYAITPVDGATLYEVAGMVDDQLYLDEVVAPFAAGKPYIFKADAAEIAAGKVVFTYDDAAASVAAPVAATGLVGTFAATTIAADGKYVITNNAVKPASAASTVGEYRAYIDLDGVVAPAAPAPGVRRVILNLGHVATDIEGLEAAQADGKLLINGQLVIIREGVRYNAQGNVIK